MQQVRRCIPVKELQRKAGAGDGGVGAGAQEHRQQDAQADRDAHEGGVRDARRPGEANLRRQQCTIAVSMKFKGSQRPRGSMDPPIAV